MLRMPGFTVEPCGGVVSLIPQQNKCDEPDGTHTLSYLFALNLQTSLLQYVGIVL